MSTQVTLAYTITNVSSNFSDAQLSTKLAAVSLDFAAIEAIAGVTLSSDTTVGLTRTIVFNLTAAFKSSFPDSSDQKAPFRDLYTNAIGQALVCSVSAAAPVLS